MYPKEAWKFRLWTDAMLRGAHVGKPEYKGKTRAKSTGSKVSRTRRRRRRRKKRQNAT